MLVIATCGLLGAGVALASNDDEHGGGLLFFLLSLWQRVETTGQAVTSLEARVAELEAHSDACPAGTESNRAGWCIDPTVTFNRSYAAAWDDCVSRGMIIPPLTAIHHAHNAGVLPDIQPILWTSTPTTSAFGTVSHSVVIYVPFTPVQFFNTASRTITAANSDYVCGAPPSEIR